MSQDTDEGEPENGQEQQKERQAAQSKIPEGMTQKEYRQISAILKNPLHLYYRWDAFKKKIRERCPKLAMDIIEKHPGVDDDNVSVDTETGDRVKWPPDNQEVTLEDRWFGIPQDQRGRTNEATIFQHLNQGTGGAGNGKEKRRGQRPVNQQTDSNVTDEAQEKAITSFNRDNPQGKQIVMSLNQNDLETFWRSTMNLEGCGDGKIAHTIITSRWTTTATNDFNNMLGDLAIRGKFRMSV
jgi:hypothetical protein